jgi:putative hydrolase of the HAD superfamily
MRLEAVLLDLGNVLAFHDNALLFRRFAERAGLPVEEVVRRFEPSFWEGINRGRFDGDRLRQELANRLGLRLNADELFSLWNCHFTVNTAILPHVEALLGKVKVLLLSNTNELHARYLKSKLPVLARFDALLLSNELGLVKPEPAIFQAALAAAGTAAEATAFFDDLPEYVLAARKLGIRAEVFAETADFPDQLRALGLELGRDGKSLQGR